MSQQTQYVGTFCSCRQIINEIKNTKGIQSCGNPDRPCSVSEECHKYLVHVSGTCIWCMCLANVLCVNCFMFFISYLYLFYSFKFKIANAMPIAMSIVTSSIMSSVMYSVMSSVMSSEMSSAMFSVMSSVWLV